MDITKKTMVENKSGKNSSQSRTFESFSEAEEFYLAAMQRLLNVGLWNALTGSPTGQFKLLNHKGEPKSGAGEEGDFIALGNYIDQQVGEKFLLIEKRISKQHDHLRSVALMTRPVSVQKTSSGISYTVNQNGTYTLVVQLMENKVVAGVFEQDQEATTKLDESFYDKMLHKLKDVFTTETEENWWRNLIPSLLK